MRGIFKLLIKIISTFLLVFMILTFIIVITKISTPHHADIDLDSMTGVQKEIFLKRYGSDLTITSLNTFERLKNDIIDYYKMIFSGDLGWTYEVVTVSDSYGNSRRVVEKLDPVDDILKTGFNKSIKLLAGAIIIALILGILKGVFDSKKDKKNNSTLKLFTTVLGLSIPVIFLVPLSQFLLRIIRITFEIDLLPALGDETLKHTILPIIVLSIFPTMYIARITASSIDRAYDNEYVKTAKSKGSSTNRIIWIHVFKNAIVEVVGSLPAVVSMLISNLALVEYLFNYRGLTYLMIENYNDGQSDVVTGIALVLCVVFLSSYLLFKVIKFILDPKGRERIV